MKPETQLAIHLREKELKELYHKKNSIEMELGEVLERLEEIKTEIKELKR